MLAVGRMHELAFPHWPQPCLAHQAADFEPADTDAAIGQFCHDAAAAIPLLACRQSCAHMKSRFAHRRRVGTPPGVIETGTANTKHTTALRDKNGLHLQHVDQSETYFSSRAKKVKAFLRNTPDGYWLLML